MSTSESTIEAVEKGFSSYVKSCLRHASRDYFKKLHRDYYHLRSFDELACEVNIILNICANPINEIEENAILSEAIGTLSASEKRVLYQKFIQEKTDKEIALSVGVTRQAITKSKINVLVKLKSQLE
ncbi:MAG: hypothetical protein K0R57_2859 [Paenibacillaceae bacterium]|nr:hypothetical protein [Paenibacillaceae bacterium]